MSESISSIFQSITNSYRGIEELIFVLAFIAGAVLIGVAISRLRSMVDNAARGGANGGYFTLLAMFIAGGFLMKLSLASGMGTETIFGGNTSITSYTGAVGGGSGAQGQLAIMLKSLAGFSQLVGFASIFYAWVLFSRLGTTNGQSSWGGFFAFFLGGIAAANPVLTAELVATTFGLGDVAKPYLDLIGT